MRERSLMGITSSSLAISKTASTPCSHISASATEAACRRSSVEKLLRTAPMARAKPAKPLPSAIVPRK